MPGSADRAVFDGTSNANCTIDINATIQGINTNTAYGGIIFQGSSTITITSSLVIAGSEDFDPGNGLIVFGGNVTLNSLAPVYNAEITGNRGIILGTNLNVLNELTLTSVNTIITSTLSGGGGALLVAGNVIVNDPNGWGATGVNNTAQATLNLVGGSDQIISSTSFKAVLPQLNVSKSGGNVLLATDLEVSGRLSGSASAHIRSASNATSKLVLIQTTLAYEGDVENVEITGNGGISLSANFSILNELTLTSVNTIITSTLSGSGGTIRVGGNVIANDPDGWRATGANNTAQATLNLVGAGDQIISSTGFKAVLPQLQVSKSGGHVLLATDLEVSGRLSGSASAHIRSASNATSKLVLIQTTLAYEGDVENAEITGNGNISLSANFSVLNELTLTSVNAIITSTLSGSGGTIRAGGNVIANDPDGWGATGANNTARVTLNLVGGGDQTLSGNGKIPQLLISKPTGKVLLPSSAVANGFERVTISSGTWDVSGYSVSSSGGFTSNGGIITGTGTLNGAVTCSNGGGIAPGNGAGCLTINGNLSMGSGSTLTVDIANGDACTNYDQLVVNGTANVNGATLVGGTVSRLTAPIKILENDGADGTFGPFVSAPNNATITLGGIAYKIKYNVANNDITLEDPNPNRAPTAVCKPVTVAANGPGCTATVNAQDFNNGSSDPEGGNLTYSVLPAGPYAVGITSVTLTVTDPLGATASCQTTVTVQNATEAPSVNDASNSFTYNGNQQTATATAGNAAIVQYFSAPVDGEPVNPVGTNAGTYTYYAQAAVNGCVNANRTKVTLQISKAVLSVVVDNKPRDYGQDNPELTGTVTGVIPSDGIAVTYSTTADKNSEAREGGYPITATLVDPNNKLNNYTVSNTPGVLTVVGKANQSPVAVAKPLVVSADANCQGVAVAAAFDNGSSDPDGDAMTFSVSPAGPFAPGVTNVVFTVTDAQGAKASTNTTITVEDKQAPTFTAPADRNVNLIANCSFVIPDLLAGLTGSDNCGKVSFTQNPAAGTTVNSSAGQTYPVTITAKDEAGNTTEKTVTLTAKDEQKPVVVVQNLTLQLDATGKASLTPAQLNNGSSDNCTEAINLKLSLDKTSFDCSNLGANTVTLTVTDASGNQAEATATVTVEDKLAPVIATNGDKTLGTDAGQCGAVVAVSASASDNCSVGTPIGVRNDGRPLADAYPVGKTTITWSVTDANGNAGADVTQTIVVEDREKPLASAKSFTVQLDATGKASITVERINNSSSDACGIQSLSLDKTSFDCTNLGQNTVTLTVTDIHGNQSTASAVVTVEDLIKPVITCPADELTRCFAADNTYQIPALVASDNCAIATVSYVISGATTRSGTGTDASGLFQVGTSTIQWTVTDRAAIRRSAAVRW